MFQALGQRRILIPSPKAIDPGASKPQWEYVRSLTPEETVAVGGTNSK